MLARARVCDVVSDAGLLGANARGRVLKLLANISSTTVDLSVNSKQ